jgi:hypothetical protein
VISAAQRWVKIVRGPETPIQEFGGTKLRGLIVDVTAVFGKDGGDVATTRSIREWFDGPLANLPRVAKIEFDTAELDDLEKDGHLLDVAIHEVGHALGFGITWRDRRLLGKDNAGRPDFRGPAGMAEYGRLRGTATPLAVPIDYAGGKAGGHWREKTFGAELMTTRMSKGSQPVSRMTVASLEDLGYVVNLEAADVFKPVPGWGKE